MSMCIKRNDAFKILALQHKHGFQRQPRINPIESTIILKLNKGKIDLKVIFCDDVR